MKTYGFKSLARHHGIPKAFRRHAERYGVGIPTLLAEHMKYKGVLTLDQAASARRAKRNVFGIDPLRQTSA